MDKIIELDPLELQKLLSHLAGKPVSLPGDLYKLRVCIVGDSVQFKRNEDVWTHGMGHLDPMCQVAQRRKHEPQNESERKAFDDYGPAGVILARKGQL